MTIIINYYNRYETFQNETQSVFSTFYSVCSPLHMGATLSPYTYNVQCYLSRRPR